MSKSLKRVLADAERLNLGISITKMPDSTLTAQMAADAVGCNVDQIIKSIVFRVDNSDEHVLFLTAGGNRVDPQKASQIVGAPLVKADAASIRSYTGFAIGGVSPLGHMNPIRTYFDPKISTFEVIWAAAGTPHHVFDCEPGMLLSVINAIEADFTSQDV